MKLVPALLLMAATVPFAHAENPAVAQPVAATVDAAKLGAPISPYLYGQFVEHAGNMVYRSMWSELLDDRKFFHDVGPKPAPEPKPKGGPGGGFFGRLDSGPGRWNPVGPAGSVVMDTVHPFAGEHTPLVKLSGAAPCGIRQDGVKLTKGVTYQGRVQLAGDASAEVAVSLVWGEASDSPRQTVKLGHPGTDYQKVPFTFVAERTGDAVLEITGTGSGAFHVGAVSLMPADNLEGWKPEPIAVLKSLRSGVYRFPGGNFVSAHEWRHGVGEPDRRPPIKDPVWNSVNSNDVGTDEFLTMCRLLEVDPYITVNAGSGDEWSAAQWVEYTNGAADTPMGRQRAANGHPAPYGVKFWGIGNEMWGDYQYGYMPLKQFLWKHNEFAKAMRKVDPSIVLIASGAMPDTMTGAKQALLLGKDIVPDYFSPADWTGALLQHCFDNFELISEHFYNFGGTHFSLAKNDQVPNDPNEPVTDWMRRGANHVQIKVEQYREYEKRLPQLKEHPKPINLDEWGYIGGKYESYPAYAWIFHELFRHTDIYQMAAHTFAFSLLTRDTAKPELTANGLVFKIYRDHFGTIPVAVTGNSPQPKPTEPFGGEQPSVNAGSPTFPLDVVAAWTTDRKALTIAVLNPTDVEQPLALAIEHAGLAGPGTLWRLGSTQPDAKDPTITSAALDGVPATLQLPRFSISIYEFPVK
jgi:alpha-N-arabinofuranosidase